MDAVLQMVLQINEGVSRRPLPTPPVRRNRQLCNMCDLQRVPRELSLLSATVPRSKLDGR
jgi:hypothetical protein